MYYEMPCITITTIIIIIILIMRIITIIAIILSSSRCKFIVTCEV